MKYFLSFFFVLFVAFGTCVKAQNQLIVLNKSGNTAWQLDATTGEKVAEYATGIGPHEVDVSPDHSLAAVTNYGADEPGNTITLIDINEQEVIKTISLGEFKRPHGIEWFSDGKHLAVSAETRESVIIVNSENGEITKTIKTNQPGSHMVEISADEKRIFVPNLGSGTLSVLSIPEENLITTLATGEQSEGITLANNGREVWVTNRGNNTISVINTETHETDAELESSTFPIRAETSPNGKWVAVSNARSSTVTVFEVSSKKSLQTISTKTPGIDNGVPIGLIFSSDSNRLYIANSNANQIVVVDTSSWKILETFETGDTPDGIAYIKM